MGLRESALKSVLSNYEELWMFIEEVSCDKSEAGAKAAGFASQLGSFQTYFNLASVDKIFTPIGTVNPHLHKLANCCKISKICCKQLGITLQNFGLQ